MIETICLEPIESIIVFLFGIIGIISTGVVLSIVILRMFEGRTPA